MDVFGQALLAYGKGEQETEIRIERDDGWIDAHSPGLYFAPEPFDFERPALARVQGPALDVGCGAGRHLLWFAKQGVQAAGLDLSPGAIEVCRDRTNAPALLCDVMHQGPDLPFAPHTLTLFGNNIGIGGTFAGAVTLLTRLHDLVLPGGRLVLTGIDVAQTETPEHLAYHAANTAQGRRKGEITIRCQYGDATSDWFPWYHPEPHEIDELAARSGWTVAGLERIGAFFWAELVRPA